MKNRKIQKCKNTLKLKVKRVKSVWEADNAHPRKKTHENGRDARIARIRAHGLNPMGSDGLHQQQLGSDPQEMMRPFLEQISDTKENGTPALLLETELLRNRFFWHLLKGLIHLRNVLCPEIGRSALSICE